jgi:hypothetical protein
VTQCDSVMTSFREEAAPKREKGVDGVSWANANFIGSKNKENLSV